MTSNDGRARVRARVAKDHALGSTVWAGRETKERYLKAITHRQGIYDGEVDI